MIIRKTLAAAALSLMVLWAAPAAAQPQPQQRAASITFEQAETAMAAALAEARANNWNLTILISDAAGVPIYLRRMENAMPRSYDLAVGKVRTALAAQMHTAQYATAVAEGRVAAVPDAVTFDGGFLLRVNGEIVGAMSASGARAVDDAQVVRAGMAAIGIQP